MLPKKPSRQDPATLIWEYLDGGISPSRAEALSKMLSERPAVRDQLIESAVLHGMLHAHCRADTAAPQVQADATGAQPGRSSAA